MNNYKKIIFKVMPILGLIFCFIYLNRAAINVVYSDYLRITINYLPDVGNPEKFFVQDIFTRIPITFLVRIINVNLFKFSTMFDMTLGIISLVLSAFVIAKYMLNKQMGILELLSVIIVIFSLNKWEMLTNGTGWVHFLAFAGFYHHYFLIDKVLTDRELVYNKTRKYDERLILLAPTILTLLIAGQYCAVYSVTLFITYMWLIYIKRDNKYICRKYVKYFIAALIPFIIYFISNALVTEATITANVDERPIITAFIAEPLYFMKFLAASFSGVIIGNDTAIKYFIEPAGSFKSTYIIGFVIIFMYIAAIILNIKRKIYEKTLFPIMLIVAGIGNHLIVLMSRWRFGSIEYALSSRYSLQFQIGIIGIMLTLFIVRKEYKDKIIEYKNAKAKSSYCKYMIKVICIMFTMVFIIGGNIFTSVVEWKIAPYRKENFRNLAELALRYEEASDEELRAFQYPPERVRKALKILEENKLNVFR